MTNKPRILVTSAAGRNGSAAVLELLRKGFRVRAFVRRNDARSETLRKAGAEIFVGDLFDLSDLRRALVDVQRAYHCPPFAPNLLHGTMLFALAAEEAKLEVVALMSGWNPHPAHPALVTREHWIANNIYQWMPTVEVIHVNPGIFAFMYLLGLPAIVHFGMLAGPWGDGLNAPPSGEDIGSVAAGLRTARGPGLRGRESARRTRSSHWQVLPSDGTEAHFAARHGGHSHRRGRSQGQVPGRVPQDVSQGSEGAGSLGLRDWPYRFLLRGDSWWHVCGRSTDRSRSRDLRQATGVFRDGCSAIHRPA